VELGDRIGGRAVVGRDAENRAGRDTETGKNCLLIE
jgi:hypothetical protein